MTGVPGFGRPTEALYEKLDGLSLTARTAWLEAQTNPDRAEEILEGWAREVRHLTTIAGLHLSAAVEQGKKRGNAAEAAKIDAERRIRNGLHVVATSVLGDGFNPHGYYVYCLWGQDEEKPLYVGQSTNILSRLGSHLGDGRKRREVRRVSLIVCKGPRHMTTTEKRLIKHYQPEWNSVGIERKRRSASVDARSAAAA